MKILVVGHDFPWPQVYGTNFRLAHTVNAASLIADTDFFCQVGGIRSGPFEAPPDIVLRRLETPKTVVPNASALRRLKWITAPGKPLEVVAAHSTAMMKRFSDWVDPPYDLCWFNKAATFELMGRPKLGPTIVDLDDLEDQKIIARMAIMEEEIKGRSALRKSAARRQASLNANRWATLQMRIANEVERVALCSDLDATRFSAPNVFVVPNGYDKPLVPAGTPEVGDPPTILLQGSMRYAPNTDAARWLVDEISPLIRREIPTVEIRLVGDPDGSVMRLNDPPRTTLVGLVPQMAPELARADVVAVPIRYGSGTRIKILEAFAHGVPVVSTTLGAEGLGIEPNEHYLAGDDPESFAKACCTLLRDGDLRQRLIDQGRQVFLERFQWSAIEGRIKELMLSVAGASDS
ncbi:MAG: glycosyltransferase [Acidimicrobiales bacterium]